MPVIYRISFFVKKVNQSFAQEPPFFTRFVGFKLFFSLWYSIYSHFFRIMTACVLLGPSCHLFFLFWLKLVVSFCLRNELQLQCFSTILDDFFALRGFFSLWTNFFWIHLFCLHIHTDSSVSFNTVAIYIKLNNRFNTIQNEVSPTWIVGNILYILIANMRQIYSVTSSNFYELSYWNKEKFVGKLSVGTSRLKLIRICVGNWELFLNCPIYIQSQWIWRPAKCAFVIDAVIFLFSKEHFLLHSMSSVMGT